MAAVYAQNMGEGSGMLVDRDKRGATEGSSYKEVSRIYAASLIALAPADKTEYTAWITAQDLQE